MADGSVATVTHNPLTPGTNKVCMLSGTTILLARFGSAYISGCRLCPTFAVDGTFHIQSE